MRLKNVELSLPKLKPAAREILSRCDQLLARALEENRRIARNLRPSDLDDFGLFAACRNFCDEMQLRTNLEIQCRIPASTRRLPAAIELNLFRIVQEAINNIEKHARAKTIKVQLGFRGKSIHLRIQDDGRGFDLHAPSRSRNRSHGLGLTNMRERASSMGGTCKIQSLAQKGTTITVTVPLREATAQAARPAGAVARAED
jgi:signal transduction histidine kinase